MIHVACMRHLLCLSNGKIILYLEAYRKKKIVKLIVAIKNAIENRKKNKMKARWKDKFKYKLSIFLFLKYKN